MLVTPSFPPCSFDDAAGQGAKPVARRTSPTPGGFGPILPTATSAVDRLQNRDYRARQGSNRRDGIRWRLPKGQSLLPGSSPRLPTPTPLIVDPPSRPRRGARAPPRLLRSLNTGSRQMGGLRLSRPHARNRSVDRVSSLHRIHVELWPGPPSRPSRGLVPQSVWSRTGTAASRSVALAVLKARPIDAAGRWTSHWDENITRAARHCLPRRFRPCESAFAATLTVRSTCDDAH